MRMPFKCMSLLCLALAAPPALATQNYSEEVCTVRLGAERLKFYSSEGENMAVVQGTRGNFDLSVSYFKKGGEPPAGDEDLVLQVRNQKHAKWNRYSDRCYAGRTGSFLREVRVLRASRPAREQLKVKKNQNLELRCVWERLESRDDCSNK